MILPLVKNNKRHSPMVGLGLGFIIMGGAAFAEGSPGGGWALVFLGIATVFFFEWDSWRRDR